MKREEKRVKKLVPYGLWDFTGLQTWLNQQAQAGYALEKWPGWSFIGIAYFKKDPSAVHARYRLDPMQERLGVVELKKREEGYQALGWNYVGQINRLYAIYRCDNPEAPELYNDADSLCWAMKKQVRWAWISLPILLVWGAVLFWDEWPQLLNGPMEFVMRLILHADVPIPIYAMMLILGLNVIIQGWRTSRGIRRVQASFRRGEWPTAGPRRYPELCHNLISFFSLAVFVLFAILLILSGAQRTQYLSGPEEWNFPHVTLQEVLPAGATMREYGPTDLLRNDTFDHSLLAPQQYDVAQGGMVRVNDGPQQDTRLYQESVQTLSPSLAQAVYQGRIAAHRRALEKYRSNWEKNTSTLHPDLPDAYDSILEEELFIPDLDGLTRFTYQYSNETTPNMVYIGWVDNRVFVLNCSGAVDSETALTLLTQRLAED